MSHLRRLADLIKSCLTYWAVRHPAQSPLWYPDLAAGAFNSRQLVDAALSDATWAAEDDRPLYGGSRRGGRHADAGQCARETPPGLQDTYQVSREFRQLIAGQARACQETAERLRGWADEDQFPQRAAVWRRKAAAIEKRAHNYQHILALIEHHDTYEGWYATGGPDA